MDAIDENIKYANTLRGDFYSSKEQFENSKEKEILKNLTSFSLERTF